MKTRQTLAAFDYLPSFYSIDYTLTLSIGFDSRATKEPVSISHWKIATSHFKRRLPRKPLLFVCYRISIYNIETITSLCNIIYNSGMIPTEMKHSVFVTLPKKPNAMICTEFRTISLMSHVTKLLLKIIEQRMA